MADYLYVCSFSNGAVKVGRSSAPETRIAQHEDRVACLGVALNGRHITQCVGNVVAAESALIQRCAERATTRHSNEWFSGLQYAHVCGWLDEFAAEGFTAEAPSTPFGDRLAQARKARGITQTDFGRGMAFDGTDLQKATISAWECGRSSPNVDQLRRLCERLKVTPNEMVFGQSEVIFEIEAA